jgi:hypothetical protein
MERGASVITKPYAIAPRLFTIEDFNPQNTGRAMRKARRGKLGQLKPQSKTR